MDSHGKQIYGVGRLRRALTQFVGGRIIQGLGQAILVLILVRVLSPTDFGIYMLLIGLAETMLALGSLGTLQIGRRFIPRFVLTLPGPRLGGIILLLIAVQLSVLALIAIMLHSTWSVVSPAIGISDAHQEAARIAVLLFVLVPAMNFSCELLDSLLEQGRSRLVVTLLVYGRITGIGLIVAASSHALDLQRVLLLDVALVSAASALSYLLLWRSLGRLHNPEAKGDVPWAEMVRFARHMIPVDLLGACSSPGALRLVVVAAFGAAEGGLFAFLQSLQRLAGRYLPGTLLRSIVMPVLVARGGTPGGRELVETSASALIKSNLIMVAAGGVMIAVCGDELVGVLSGGRFDDAGETLLLLYAGLAVTGQRATIEMVMQVLGHGAVLGATALAAPVALAGMWIVSPYGLNAAILVMIAASALANGIAVMVLTGRERLCFDRGGQLRIVASAVLSAGAGIAIVASGGNPVIWGVVAAMMFILMQMLFRPFVATEAVLLEKVLGTNPVVSGMWLLSRPSPERQPVRWVE